MKLEDPVAPFRGIVAEYRRMRPPPDTEIFRFGGHAPTRQVRPSKGPIALRQALGLTQVELAKRLEVTQGNVAQIEKRGDLLVSTLASYLHAVGGEVRIIVQFPVGHAIEVELDALADATGERELATSS